MQNDGKRYVSILPQLTHSVKRQAGDFIESHKNHRPYPIDLVLGRSRLERYVFLFHRGRFHGTARTGRHWRTGAVAPTQETHVARV